MSIERARIEAALPHYELGTVLGRGGYGVVYRARHRRLGTMRAVKALTLAAEHDGTAEARFLTEAQVMTELDHPHIVRVHEYAEHDTLQLLVMEYLSGGSLTARLRHPVAPPVLSAWMLAAADALSAAHRRAVVHRDVKPDNLLFTGEGTLKVSDFGIAKLLAATSATAGAGFLGTPLYVAPEQITGTGIGPRTDVYALGVTLYRGLAGRPPFPPDLGVTGLIYHHLHQRPAPLPDAPPAVAAVTLRALEKNPADRPASALDFATELSAAAAHDFGPDWLARTGVPLRVETGAFAARSRASASPAPPRSSPFPPIDAERPPPPAGNPPPRRRRTRLVLAAVVTTALLAAGAVAATRSGGTDRGTPATTSGTLTGTGPVDAVAFSPDGTHLAAGSTTVQIWDAATGRPSGRAWPGPVKSVTYDVDGGRIATGGDTGAILLRDAETGAVLRTLGTADDWVRSVAFAPRGPWLAAASDDGAVRIWNLDAPAAVTLLDDTATVVAFNPDGSRLAAAGLNGTVTFLDPATGTRVGPTLGVPGALHLHSMAYNRQGTVVGAGTDDGTVQLWDAATGAPIRTVDAHRGRVDALAFLPDGRTMVTAGKDGFVHVWDVRSGERVATFGAAGVERLGVAAAPDGRRIAVASADRTVRLWSLR